MEENEREYEEADRDYDHWSERKAELDAKIDELRNKIREKKREHSKCTDYTETKGWWIFSRTETISRESERQDI